MDEDFGNDAEYAAAFKAADRTTTAPSAQPTHDRQQKVVQPTPQALPNRQATSAILVSTRQKGNPVLNHIRNLPWEYSDTPADYVLGVTTCALFLSLKYHRLHPEYLYSRIRGLAGKYNLRILLTMVDIDNHEQALKELSKTSMVNNLTVILCWSAQEAGRYLELYKSFENASPQSIRAHQASSYKESVTEFITTPRNINKTDAASLLSNFGTLRAAVNAHPEELALVPGWGEKKVKAWCSTVRENFRVRKAAKANPGLARQESTTSVGFDERVSGEEPLNVLKAPVPIGTVPSYSRENSNMDVAKIHAQGHAESHPLKRTVDAVHAEDSDIDDLSTSIAAEKTETSFPVTRPTLSEAQKDRREDILSDGVMAALSKLRKND
ncbi:MAG: hypothetical protein Q9160_000139 [Pyrenula sp. 1 TL-2023]